MTGERAPASLPGPRWQALDDLRGLAVLIMIPVNVAAVFTAVPGWFKHAPGPGLTVADLVVPLFLVSLGISAGFSWKRRVADRGYPRTLLHAFLRNAALAVFGIVGMLLADPGDRWEVLVMLAATGMLSFFFLGIRPWPRIGAAFLMLAVVETLRPIGLGALLGTWYETGLGGPWGTPSLAFFAVLASAAGELLLPLSTRQRLAALGVAAVALAALGAAALPLGPVSKHAVSASWILVTSGISAAVLAALVAWREGLSLAVPLLGSLGRNPLLLYGVHAVLGLAALAVVGAGGTAVAAWGATAAVLVLCAVLSVVLDGRRLYLKL